MTAGSPSVDRFADRVANRPQNCPIDGRPAGRMTRTLRGTARPAGASCLPPLAPAVCAVPAVVEQMTVARFSAAATFGARRRRPGSRRSGPCPCPCENPKDATPAERSELARLCPLCGLATCGSGVTAGRVRQIFKRPGLVGPVIGCSGFSVAAGGSWLVPVAAAGRRRGTMKAIAFNRRHPIGSLVRYYAGLRDDALTTITRSLARDVNGRAVVRAALRCASDPAVAGHPGIQSCNQWRRSNGLRRRPGRTDAGIQSYG